MKTIKSYFTGAHRMRSLLIGLIALVVLDGLISQFLVKHGLAREGNPLLQTLVGGEKFLVLKTAGALLCALILWDIYRRWPKLALVSSLCFMILYAGIVFWNVCVFFIANP